MTTTGFGAITYTPAPEIRDAGFGSPFDGSNLGRDTGFGAPFDPSLMSLAILGDTHLIGDDGGVRIDVTGQWYEMSGTPTPAYTDKFVVKFRLRGTAQTYNALAGFMAKHEGGSVYSDMTQTVLYAYVPPLPHGVYDLQVRWDGHVATISEAFEVTTRNRSVEVFSIRNHLPAHMKRGATIASDETLVAEAQYGIIEAFTKSVGEMIQRLSGRPLTLMTQQWSEGDATLHVESTVGFEDSGAVNAGGVRLKYEGKTANTFTGVTHLSGKLEPIIRSEEKVVPYADPRE